MRWQGKKGFYWEVTPERRASVEREVERYLRQEGKLREMDEIDGSEFVLFLKYVSKMSLLVYSCSIPKLPPRLHSNHAPGSQFKWWSQTHV